MTQPEPIALKIRETFQHIARNNFANYNPNLNGAVVGLLQKYAGGKTQRHYITKYLCGKSSTKMLNHGEWAALHRFVKPTKYNIDEPWDSGNPRLKVMCKAILETEPTMPKEADFLRELGFD